MRLHGSCQCGKIRFTVQSDTPYPYQLCFCSICRKTAGGGWGCNLLARRETLKVRGERHLERYHARVRNPGERAHLSSAWRVFCRVCGTHLWLEDPDDPDGLWPNAGAIDDELPVPPSHVFLMLAFKPSWVPLPKVRRAEKFAKYPKLAIVDWHARHQLGG